MQDCCKDCLPKLGSRAKNHLLLESEESVLINWIYSLEHCSFLLYIIDVQQIAQILVDQYRSIPKKYIGKLWVYRFVKQHPQLDACLARSYNTQQAKNKDPKVISK